MFVFHYFCLKEIHHLLLQSLHRAARGVTQCPILSGRFQFHLFNKINQTCCCAACVHCPINRGLYSQGILCTSSNPEWFMKPFHAGWTSNLLRIYQNQWCIQAVPSTPSDSPPFIHHRLYCSRAAASRQCVEQLEVESW